MGDLISRAAAIAEIEEYIEEYSELEPETGYHNLKWCAMSEAKDVLTMLPAVDAIPVEWLREKIKEHTDKEGWQDYLAHSFGLCIEEWQKKQEAR